jgi:DNA-binding CsgD family transcriptional regulator
MSRAPIDLDRLNEAERRVLRLLAEGHTAKSVANSIGSTPAAVNERLREARRKTGASSSRELARLLRAQENRHEQIGVGRSRAIAAGSLGPAAEPWRPEMGVIAMIALFAVVAAGAAALMPQESPTNPVDPLIGMPLQTGPDPTALHAKVRAEARDPNWAPSMEASIRPLVLQIPLIGKGGNVLRVTCATSLCEIAGTMVWPVSLQKGYDPKLPQSRAQSALQDKPLNDDLAKLGLKRESGLFTNANGKPDRMVFLLYYSRTPAKSK